MPSALPTAASSSDENVERLKNGTMIPECHQSHSGSCVKCNIRINGTNDPFCNQHISFDELKKEISTRCNMKMHLFNIALEEDDTIISDDEYLHCLEGGTQLAILPNCGLDDVDAGLTHSSNAKEELNKTLEEAVKKLKSNIGFLTVLPQDELQELFEVDDDKLKSLLGLSSSEAEKFKSLCFEIFVKRDKDNDRLGYLDVRKRAKEWEKQKNISSKVNKAGEGDTLGSEDSCIEADRGVGGGGDEVDAPVHINRNELIGKLQEELGDNLVPLMNLKREEYEVLINDDTLETLNIPYMIRGDVFKYCSDQFESKTKEQKLNRYFNNTS